MDGTIIRLAADLGLDVSGDIPERVLDLASLVAHATERKNAPLATYLAGQYVARRIAEGATPHDAIAELRLRIVGALPAEAPAA